MRSKPWRHGASGQKGLSRSMVAFSDDQYLDWLRTDALELGRVPANRVGEAVDHYPEWNIHAVLVHLGRVHRWTSEVLKRRRMEPPEFPRHPEIGVEDVPEWVMRGALELADQLGELDPKSSVWTPFDHERTASYWFRRMALETCQHLWDVKRALQSSHQVPADLALEGVREAVELVQPYRVDGNEAHVESGSVRLCIPRRVSWTVTMNKTGIHVSRCRSDSDVTVTADPEPMWLLVTGRCLLDEVAVEGNRRAADAYIRIIDTLQGPSRTARCALRKNLRGVTHMRQA